MRLSFKHEFNLPLAELYSYARTPADWTRIFGFPGDPIDLGDGWFSLPLKNFPFPLVAKNVEQEELKFAKWVFKGFWRGHGEMCFTETDQGVLVEGYEEVSVRWLFFLSPIIEKLFLEKGFEKIWNIGWRKLRKRQQEQGQTTKSELAGP